MVKYLLVGIFKHTYLIGNKIRRHRKIKLVVDTIKMFHTVHIEISCYFHMCFNSNLILFSNLLFIQLYISIRFSLDFLTIYNALPESVVPNVVESFMIHVLVLLSYQQGHVCSILYSLYI